MKVLVVCTGNSCRSQMAEAFFNAIDGVEAQSAGTHPEKVNPLAIAVMNELNIDISKNESNHLDEFIDQNFDYIITVCDRAEKECPVFHGGGKRVHHAFKDPAKASGTPDQILDKFREARKAIDLYVTSFVNQNM
ncbi:MAG: arsenate reductase ArsC [Flavobacteriales bacterium]|nr:arsenate reductase ArsC [Flavobacteriales bacterium]